MYIKEKGEAIENFIDKNAYQLFDLIGMVGRVALLQQLHLKAAVWSCVAKMLAIVVFVIVATIIES